MNLRSLSVADSGWLARWTLLINKIETEGQRCVAWPLSVIKTHSLNSALRTKPHIIQLLPSANTIQQCRAYCDDLWRIKMHYYNKGGIVYVDIAVVWIEWVRSQLEKLLSQRKGLFINMKSLLRSLLYYENIALSGADSFCCLITVDLDGHTEVYSKIMSRLKVNFRQNHISKNINLFCYFM